MCIIFPIRVSYYYVLCVLPFSTALGGGDYALAAAIPDAAASCELFRNSAVHL